MGKIIDWFKARKEAIVNNKTLGVIINYFRARAKSKMEILLRGFGGVLTVWTVAIFAALVAMATGLDPQWSLVLAAGLGATGQYLTQVYRILFGKPKITEEELDEILDEPVIQ